MPLHISSPLRLTYGYSVGCVGCIVCKPQCQFPVLWLVKLRFRVLKKEFLAKLTSVLLLSCSVFFAVDVVVDVSTGEGNGLVASVHLIVETIATLSILFSLVFLRDYIRMNGEREAEILDSLSELKKGLNHLILKRIDELCLPPAEAEVAVLTIKGLSILEIAELRNTSSGTVKAQQHSIYQKAGVKSRAELILNCIEEVTDSSPLISN